MPAAIRSKRRNAPTLDFGVIAEVVDSLVQTRNAGSETDRALQRYRTALIFKAPNSCLLVPVHLRRQVQGYFGHAR